MKIICTQENLKSGLAVVGRIVSSSNTLPILNNVLVGTENGMLKISSTNLEVAIVTKIRCRVEEDGETTVVAKTFNELVNNMPSENITITSSGPDLFINTENYHTNIKTLPAEDFPLIPQLDGGAALVVDAQELKKSLDAVVFAVSTNQTQPEISGVLIAGEGKILKIAATDRYRLAEKTLELKKPVNSLPPAIIPQKTALELSRIIGSQSGEVEIILNNNQIGMDFNDTRIISRLVDGQYPDYQQIIPQEFTTTAILQKPALSSALRAAAVFSQANNSVKFNLSPAEQKLKIVSESAELGKSEVELAAAVEGSGGEIIFNHRYVLDCLNSLESENLVVKIIDDNSPGLILPEGKSNYLYLVMPIKS